MENIDALVLRGLCAWREAGKAAVLVTVTRTWGSSPRPLGSLMAMSADGNVVGSVSGGCLEDDILDRLVHRPAENWRAWRRTQVLRYGLNADEAHRFGLPCGGTIELLVEYNPDAAHLRDLLNRLDHGELVLRTVRRDTARATLSRTRVPALLRVTDDSVALCLGPAYRMLIIGAGQLSEYLATMALSCGFAVTICDPRAAYFSSWSVPAAKVVTTMPDDTVRDFGVDQRTCVVALTHDPKLDDLALLEALDTPAFYVGAIGSRRNNHARKQRMIDYFDQTEESLARLRGPIGVFIGSKTPPEIAVSVMAEILAVKNGVALPTAMNVETAKNRAGLSENTDVCLVPAAQ
ncbi:MAG: XdhC family protein [Candidimonas sp.]|nr:MAG: XdhC family protein [Candidimonas sp.]